MDLPSFHDTFSHLSTNNRTVIIRIEELLLVIFATGDVSLMICFYVSKKIGRKGLRNVACQVAPGSQGSCG